ncbi:MAG: choice-of-anchor U domain-containing protein, partial [Pseudomonadota bacterium]|nr:choice-of-anchor U domain-containing protein [Pseudomonadota bacterium]
EDDAAWGSVRSSPSDIVSAPSITNLGISWTSNNDTSGVTTSSGGTAVHSGTWGFLSWPHGDFDSVSKDCTLPGVCGDGFVATGAQGLVAVGAWFSGNFGADIDIILDGTRVDFAQIGATKLDSQHKFLGVIEVQGFKAFEVREIEGTLDDPKLIFADDFTFAMSGTPAPAGSLQFAASSFSAQEHAAAVLITVTRTGGSAGAVSVDYASSDGSATAGSDYRATAGTLGFADGVTSQSFNVAILDDTLFEGDETFNLSLSNVSGGAGLGLPEAASVTITDDDPPPLLDSNRDGLSDADAIALGLDPHDPDGDTDNDAMSDVLEVGADVNNPPDGDVDGVIDALEPGTDAADAMIASGLPLDGGGTVAITTAAGETLSRVSVAAATGGPAGINFPFGAVSYTTSAAVGGSVPVQLEFSADLPANLAIYKVDHAGVYTELATSLWTRVSPRRVDLTLTDGDPLTDLDGVVNASIEDPVAPAEVVPLAGSSSGGGGGCVLNTAVDKDPAFPLFMLAALLYRFRRRPV